jgi:hypothetical protein
MTSMTPEHPARLAVRQLIDWKRPFEAAVQIVAELAANAALHGRVQGRGLLLVEAYADRWGTHDGSAPCKTVRAELDLAP